MSGKVLLAGLGALGGWVLEFLARTPGITDITVLDINRKSVEPKVFCTISGAALMNSYPKISFIEHDISDVNKTAEILADAEPDVIINTTCLQSWWVIQELPEDVFKELEGAGYGPWLPMHLTLTYKFMQAVEKAGMLGTVSVVSSPFPDAVNPVLAKVGLAPTVGIGNIHELVPGIRFLVSKKLEVPMRSVKVYLVGHHCLVTLPLLWGTVGDIPYYLKILVDDKDVTKQFNTDELILRTIESWPPGAGDNPLVASSLVRIALAILNDTGEFTHAIGPLGLPGGYPARLSAKGVKITLPSELSLDDAVKINEEAQKFDGIEAIEDDGTVVFTEKAYTTLKKMLGYDCKELKLEDVERRARELRSLYKKFRDKFTLRRVPLA